MNLMKGEVRCLFFYRESGHLFQTVCLLSDHVKVGFDIDFPQLVDLFSLCRGD